MVIGLKPDHSTTGSRSALWKMPRVAFYACGCGKTRFRGTTFNSHQHYMPACSSDRAVIAHPKPPNSVMSFKVSETPFSFLCRCGGSLKTTPRPRPTFEKKLTLVHKNPLQKSYLSSTKNDQSGMVLTQCIPHIFPRYSRNFSTAAQLGTSSSTASCSPSELVVQATWIGNVTWG